MLTVRVISAALTSLLLCGLAFGWGAAMVQLRWWPYEHLKRFGDHPPAAQVASQAEARRTLFQTFQPKVDIVFLGDSRTAQGEWQDMFPQYRVADRGIGAEDFSNMAARLDEIIALDPDIVVLSGGINNAGRFSLAETLGQHRSIVDRLEGAEIELLLVAPIHCNCERQPFIDALRPGIQDIAKRRGLPLIDLGPRLAPGGMLRPEFTFDGTHLTGPAYAEWQAALEPALETLLPRQSS